MNFKKKLQAAMPKMIGNPLSVATAMVSFALSVVKGQKAKKATKGKKKTTVRKSKIMSKKQQMEVMERICQSAYGTYIRGATTVAARYIGHPAVAIPASEMVKTMMDEVAPPIHKYHVVTPKEKKKIDIKEDALNIMLIFADSDLERKEKKTTVSFKNDTEWAMFNGFIRSVQYLNNKYHPEIRKASEELQQKKDNWIKESVEFARRVCIEYPEYATMTNKLLYNIPIDETKLNNEEKVELMLSGFASGFIKDSALGLNGLADAAIYPIDTMEVLTSPDIASVAWDGMTRDIKADWKEGTIQGKSEAVGRTASVTLPFLGVISKITKATGTAGKLTGTAAREAAERAAQEAAERAAQEAAERATQEATERAAQEAAERAAQEAAERTAQETTERAGKEVSQEVAERARKTDNSIPVKRGDNSGANSSGVKISGEKPKTDVGEVKVTGAGSNNVVKDKMPTNNAVNKTNVSEVEISSNINVTKEVLIRDEGILYTPMNPGPLPKEIAETFTGGSYVKKVLKEDTVFYRAYGGNGKEVGRYVTRIPQNGGIQTQIDLALNPDWGNTTEYITKVVVPKGTIIYEGTAAPQIINGGAGMLLGGGNQIYIPEVDASWFGK